MKPSSRKRWPWARLSSAAPRAWAVSWPSQIELALPPHAHELHLHVPCTGIVHTAGQRGTKATTMYQHASLLLLTKLASRRKWPSPHRSERSGAVRLPTQHGAGLQHVCPSPARAGALHIGTAAAAGCAGPRTQKLLCCCRSTELDSCPEPSCKKIPVHSPGRHAKQQPVPCLPLPRTCMLCTLSALCPLQAWPMPL